MQCSVPLTSSSATKNDLPQTPIFRLAAISRAVKNSQLYSFFDVPQGLVQVLRLSTNVISYVDHLDPEAIGKGDHVFDLPEIVAIGDHMQDHAIAISLRELLHKFLDARNRLAESESDGRE